jgi:hypothetical protein
MPAALATSYLDANLRSLGRRNSELAGRLAGVVPPADLLFANSSDGVPSALLAGRQLCSKVRPLQEASRLVDGIDLVEHAVIVVLGFGLGWHVKRLVERAGKTTLVVVFEPDLALLRGVFEQIDHSSWMNDALLLFVSDAGDRGALAQKLHGGESIVGQGVHVLEHPPSRARLGLQAAEFTRTFSEFVATARTTLATTLMRSVDTTRNLLANLDHYVGGSGVAELADLARRFPAVVVSAGPSLHRNMHLLAEPGVRERCVIIAVQTALKPLLAAGIRPHFVTALDYHEISRRFYEDIDPAALCEVTLVADPKVHPSVLDVYPGPIRCCANGFLDKLLGPLKRDMGDLPAGATVAHLAMYLARHMGCDPVAMIGQDLGFPDGLYYAPGAVIHETWAPELNPFNTIAMMEWQRIVRHRLHLRKTKDADGKSIYTDAQMHAYLQQFERDFADYAQKGLTTIDATEGGVAKQHARTMPLREFLDHYATRQIPTLPLPGHACDAARLNDLRARLGHVQNDIARLGELSRDTAGILQKMMDDQRDAQRMARHFAKVQANRREVDQRFEAFELLNLVNQMGVFRRMKADRRLQLAQGLDPLTVQRRQLERDLENVRWLGDAALETLAQLEMARAALDEDRGSPACSSALEAPSPSIAAPVSSHIAALVAVDPRRNGLGIERSLAQTIHGKTVLQATLERLGQSKTLASIVLIVPRDFDPEPLIERPRIGLPVEIEHCEGDSPFPVEHEAVAIGRLFADTCWRGGIAGISVYDEALCPQIMSAIMQRRGLAAALIAAPDWPLINVVGEGGCDAVVRRHLEHPQQHNLVFTQAPPGLCGCVVSATLMAELANRNRLSTIGGLLVYQPHAPQHDPIAREACVQVPHAIRQSLSRVTFDTPRCRAALESIQTDAPQIFDLDAALALAHAHTPQHVVLELNTDRISTGIFAKSLNSSSASRQPFSLDCARKLFDELAEAKTPDIVLTLHGAGDPLLHPQFDEMITSAKRSGIRAVHVRTELLVESPAIDHLLASGVDVVSVDLNADRAATYLAMMGVDRFRDALMNLEYLINNRRRLTPQKSTAAMALPWVVPHLQRRAETYEDIDTFFDRWQGTLGACVIDDPPAGDSRAIGLTPAVTPPRMQRREALRRMTILCDGRVPLHDLDFTGNHCAGNIMHTVASDLWQTLRAQRAEISQERPT